MRGLPVASLIGAAELAAATRGGVAYCKFWSPHRRGRRWVLPAVPACQSVLLAPGDPCRSLPDLPTPDEAPRRLLQS